MAIFDKAQCVTELRFAKGNIPRVSNALQRPGKTVCRLCLRLIFILYLDLITSLILGTKMVYSRTTWHYIATLFIRREPHSKIAWGLLLEQF